MTHYDQDMTSEIKRIIAKISETSEATVAESHSIADLPGWDSLKQIILLATMERELEVKISMDAFLAARELNEIVGLVCARRSQS